MEQYIPPCLLVLLCSCPCGSLLLSDDCWDSSEQRKSRRRRRRLGKKMVAPCTFACIIFLLNKLVSSSRRVERESILLTVVGRSSNDIIHCTMAAVWELDCMFCQSPSSLYSMQHVPPISSCHQLVSCLLAGQRGDQPTPSTDRPTHPSSSVHQVKSSWGLDGWMDG